MNKNFREICKDFLGSQFYVNLLQPKPRTGFSQDSRYSGVSHILVSGKNNWEERWEIKKNCIIVGLPWLDQIFCDNEQTGIPENFGEILGKF